MVCGDETPFALRVVHDANHRGLAFEFGHIPEHVRKLEASTAGRLHDDFIIHQELHSGFSRSVAARNEKHDVVLLDFEFRGSQGADGVVAAMGGKRESVVGVITERFHAIQFFVDG